MNVHNETVMTMGHSTFLNTRRRGKGFWQLTISRAISYSSFRIGAAILDGLSTNHRWSDWSRLVRGYLLVTKWASYSQVFVVPTYRDYIHFLFKINLKITWIFMFFKELHLLPTSQKSYVIYLCSFYTSIWIRIINSWQVLVECIAEKHIQQNTHTRSLFFEQRIKSVDEVSFFSRKIHKATKKTLILWLVFRWEEVNRRMINLIVAILSLDRNVLQLTPMFSPYSACCF